MTSVLQPCDAGIIKAFKAHYKKYLLMDILENYDDTKTFKLLDVKAALYLIKKAWSDVSSFTIKNCWKHCDIIKEIIDNDDEATETANEKIVKENNIVITNIQEFLNQFRHKSQLEGF